MNATHLTRLGALVAALALAGCAPEDPYQQERGQPQPGSPARASQAPRAPLPDPPADGELPGHVPAELVDQPTSFPEAGQTPQATLQLAARLYGNWTSADAQERLRRIAALSVGQAHAELRQAAAQAGLDRQQQGAHARAHVETINIRAQGPRRRALIVTRELLRAPELPAQGWRYRVTLATLDQRPDGWVISRWEPQR